MRFDSDPEFKQRAQQAVVRLQVKVLIFSVFFIHEILGNLLLNFIFYICIYFDFRVGKTGIARHGNKFVKLVELNSTGSMNASEFNWRKR